MAALDFLPLLQIIKNNDHNNTARSKISADTVENALFNYLILKSQNKTLYQSLNNPNFLEQLKKKYTDEIEGSRDKKDKPKYKSLVQSAFDRFNFFLSVRQALFSGSKLKLAADKMSILRNQYLRRKKKRARNAAESERELEIRKSDKEEEKILQEMDLARKKKQEEEEGHHKHYQLLGGALLDLAVLLRAQADSKTVTDNVHGVLSTLNQSLEQAMKLHGIDLKLAPTFLEELKKNVFDLEQGMRNPGPNTEADSNNQFDLILAAFQQQYQRLQAAIPANNVQAQEMLQQWATQAAQCLTQWFATGNVQKPDVSFKDALDKSWTPAAGLAQRDQAVPAAQTAQIAQTVQTDQRARPQIPLARTSANADQKMRASQESLEDSEEKVSRSRGASAWPPKPTPNPNPNNPNSRN